MSKSPHSSPAFMVRNHAEIKRGKARMVINYKELNKNCIFDGYFIPNKNNLINLAKGKTYFSKFDCKSGFWQIKLAENSIQLTALELNLEDNNEEIKSRLKEKEEHQDE